MGKLLVTNNREWGELLRKLFKKYQFEESMHMENITSYKKMYVDHCNSYRNGEDAVIGAGTWVYRGMTGSEALKNLYNDGIKCNMDIPELRRELLGTYAVVLKVKDRTVIFVDETHTYALYYYNKDGEYLITNTYYHIQKCVKQELDKDIFKLVLAVQGLSENRTPYKNIFRLKEDEYLEILSDGKMVCKKCRVNTRRYHFTELEEVVDTLGKELENCAGKLSQLSSRKLLYLTGGADSRLILALDRFLKNDVCLGYWNGSDCITNGTESDIETNRKVAEMLALSSRIFDVSEGFEESLNTLDSEECDKYGEYVTVYGHNTKWLSMADQLAGKVDEIELGHGADLLKELSTIESSYQDPYSVRKLIQSTFLRSGLFHRVIVENHISEIILEDIQQSLKNRDINRLSKEEAEYIFNYAKIDMGCMLSNYFNAYYYSYPLMYCRQIWDIINQIPHHFKEGSRLRCLLIEKWDPDLLKIPVFSHNHYMTYDKKQKILKRTKTHAFLSWLKPYVMDTLLYDKIYLKYIEKIIFPENLKSDEMFTFFMNYIKNSSQLKKMEIELRPDIKRKGFDLSMISDFAVRLRVLDVLENDNKKY